MTKDQDTQLTGFVNRELSANEQLVKSMIHLPTLHGSHVGVNKPTGDADMMRFSSMSFSVI